VKAATLISSHHQLLLPQSSSASRRTAGERADLLCQINSSHGV
jgi:hypothetical protein